MKMLILFKLVFSLILIAVVIKLILERITLLKLRNLKEIDIEGTPTGIIKIEDDKIRKLLIKKIAVIIKNLRLVYNNSNWDNKRFLYDE